MKSIINPVCRGVLSKIPSATAVIFAANGVENVSYYQRTVIGLVRLIVIVAAVSAPLRLSVIAAIVS